MQRYDRVILGENGQPIAGFRFRVQRRQRSNDSCNIFKTQLGLPLDKGM